MPKIILVLLCAAILFVGVKYLLDPLIGAWAYGLLFGAAIGVCVWQWVVTPIRNYRRETRFQPSERKN